MDWTKAKTILIIALVITNLVLICTYLAQNSRFQNDEKEMEEAIVKLLKEKNIFVETEIPREKIKLAKLTVQFDKMDEDAVKAQLASQQALPENARSEENLVAMADVFIEKCGLMTENVTFDAITEQNGEWHVSYKNYIDGIAIEDSYMLCVIKDGKIQDFRRYWLYPVELSDMKREVIPADAALIRFMSEIGDEAGEEKIFIEDISLIYWLDSSAFDTESPITDTAFPAWKITYNNGKTARFMAWEQ